MKKNKARNRGALLRLGVLLLYMGILLWLSLASRLPQIPVKGLSWDKLHHAGAYFVLTLLSCWALAPWAAGKIRVRAGALIFAILFGGAMELAQGVFIHTRSSSLFDMMANMIGAAAAFLLCPFLMSTDMSKEEAIYRFPPR